MAASDRRMPVLRPEMASLRLQVLAFVREYIGRWHRSPSIGEIAAGTGGNREAVRKAVRRLVRSGELLRKQGPRGLSLPAAQEEALRELEALGWTLDRNARILQPPGRAAGSVSNRPLLPPAELTYPEPYGEQDQAA